MERSKKELLEKTYREFMKVGLESNEPNLLEGLVDENVMGFGTAMDEKILGIEEFKKLLNNQKIQSESLDIIWRNEPVHRFISEDENSAVFAESIYTTIKTGEEAVEMYMRFSTVLNYSGKQWKVVHWHGSKPEEVVSEKDTWGIDIWKQKTEELEKLVKEKTADLLEKNRELEIEAALERIRARTMAMQSSDELAATASLLFQELQSLGIGTYSSGFTIWDEEQKHLISWMCNADGSMNPPFRILIEENDWHKRQFESWKKGESFLKKDFSGKEMQDYFKYLHSFPMLKKAFQKSMDAGFPLPERQIHHVANFASGNLLFITLKPLSGAQTLFQRFAKVFEQTYTRFLDLEKAENQAREAQIETCLERVRSASLAMHQTDELANVVSVLFSQFAELKLEFYQVWINIFMLEEGVSNCWFSPVEEVIDEPYTAIVPLAPFEDSSIKSWRGGEKFSYLSWKGKKEVDKIMDELSKMTGHPSFKQIQKKKKMNRMEVIDCNHKYGVVALAKNSDITEEDHSILLRFTKVFEQAYIRFLDLEKAEFQAREATIEAALEKVRSRSLAMHKSDELNEVVAVLFQKLKDLEIPFTAVGIATVIEDSKDLNSFVCGQNEEGLVITNYRLPYFQNPIPKDFYNALEKQLDFFEGHYSKEEKDAFYHHLIEHTEEFKQLPEDILEMIFNSETYCISTIAVKNAVFNINDFEGKSLAQHEIDVIQRFARVFEQAYTRFLDLQKAEAQARESEIQLALERVRARSMAMKSTDELHEVLSVLFRQFDQLGIHPMNVFLSLFDRENRTLTYRASGKSKHRQPQKQVVHVDSMEELKGIYDKFINDKSDSVEVIFYSKEVLPQVFEIFSETFDAMPEDERMKLEYFPEGGYSMAGYTPFGYLGYDHLQPATSEEKEILSRFCKEFTRVYQRFLDIQKAEAQARESQIQLSLERVRARSMAMHNSNELADVCQVLFEEISKLTKTPDRFNLVMPQEGGEFLEVWLTDQEGHKVSRKFLMSAEKSEIIKDIFKAFKKKEPVLIFDLKGKKLKDWISYSSKVLGIPFKKGQQLKERFITSTLFEYGYLGTTDHTAPSQELIELIQRFALVFEQAFRRFLDLERAEKQAREAQIEVALERIRARSMAMHTSEELNEVLSVMFKQIEELGIDAKCAHLTLMDLESNAFSFRITGKNGASNIGEQIIDLDAMPTWKETVTNWKKQKPHSHQCLVYPPKVLPDLFQIINESLQSLTPKERITFEDYPEGIFDCEGHNKFGYIGFNNSRPPTDEEIAIVIRFAREFERVYQRFLDIKKAEAQAREAQIEAALEKVRSRSLGMQSSNELQEVVQIVAEKIQELGVIVDPVGVLICTYPEGTKDVIHWTYTPADQERSKPYFMPYFEHPIWDEAWESKNRGDAYFSKTYPKGVKNKFLRTIFSRSDSDYAKLPEEYKQWQLESPIYHLSYAWAKNSAIVVPNNEGLEPDEEQIRILIRFARVFEQSYVRFLDLQKAEAQAREAQIEASLERIRARAMAMHHPDELSEVLALMFDQLSHMGVDAHWTHLTLINLENNTFIYRMTSKDGKPVHAEQVVQLDAMDTWSHTVETFKSQNPETITHIYFSPDVLPRVWELFDGIFSSLPEESKINPNDFPNGIHTTEANCKFGYLGINQSREATKEEKKILGRFGSEFGRLYQRYLDIEKAQKQAREAQIEASLERVRARAMAMHQTDELTDVLCVLFDQFDLLGINPVLTHLTLFDEANETFSIRLTTTADNGVVAEQLIDIHAIEAWKQAFA
ncbi:MAG: hypothetical protein CL555_12855 [Algoriphagus sp.]|nr:hypothetical protein [Algoriphagus sp.]